MESAPCVREGGGGADGGSSFLVASRLSDKSFEIDNKKRDWRRDGWARRPCSSRLQPHELFFRVFQASKAKPEAGVERRVEWNPRTLIRSMKNRDGPRLLAKYNKTHPYLNLWLNFDFCCFPGFHAFQREFHSLINTVLSDNELIISCTKSYVKLPSINQRMMKSAFKLSKLVLGRRSTISGVTKSKCFFIERQGSIKFGDRTQSNSHKF